MPLTPEIKLATDTRDASQARVLHDIDPLIRDKEGADMIGASVSTWWRRVADGTIPKPIKIGGLSRWRQSWIVAVIAEAEAARSAA